MEAVQANYTVANMCVCVHTRAMLSVVDDALLSLGEGRAEVN